MPSATAIASFNDHVLEAHLDAIQTLREIARDRLVPSSSAPEAAEAKPSLSQHINQRLRASIALLRIRLLKDSTDICPPSPAQREKAPEALRGRMRMPCSADDLLTASVHSSQGNASTLPAAAGTGVSRRGERIVHPSDAQQHPSIPAPQRVEHPSPSGDSAPTARLSDFDELFDAEVAAFAAKSVNITTQPKPPGPYVYTTPYLVSFGFISAPDGSGETPPFPLGTTPHRITPMERVVLALHSANYGFKVAQHHKQYLADKAAREKAASLKKRRNSS